MFLVGFSGSGCYDGSLDNEKSEVVGRWDDCSIPLDVLCSTQCHGFLWAKGEFHSIDVPGANSMVALGINNSGRIVGRFIDPAGNEHGFQAVLVKSEE